MRQGGAIGLCSILALSACRPQLEEIRAGLGLSQGQSASEHQLSVQRPAVPWVDPCLPESVLVHTAEGTRCIEADTAVVSPGPLRPDVQAMSDAVDGLLARAAVAPGPCDPLPLSVRPHNYSFDATSCAPTVLSGADPVWWVLGAPLKILPNHIGQLRLVCPMLPTCDGSDHTWSTLSLDTLDADGEHRDLDISATVYHGDRQPICAHPPSCTLHSSDSGSNHETTQTLELGDVVPSFYQGPGADPLGSNAYWLEIVVTASRSGVGEIQFHGARID